MAHIKFDASLLAPLRDKVVVLTGGATGIGASAVRLFHVVAKLIRDAEHGASVAFGDVAVDTGKALEREIASPNVAFARCDVTSYRDQLELFKLAKRRFGRVDVVIGNAGISIPEDAFAAGTDVEREPPMMEVDVNLKGALFTTRIGLHYLRESGGGDIILTSSIAGWKEAPALVPYHASKHGVVGIVRGTRIDAVKEGIHVNVICPWMTKTRLVTGIQKGWEERKLPTNEPDDIARVMAICATANRQGTGKTYDGARLPFSGKVLHVAGGQAYEIEDKLQELEPIWLGKENSEILAKGQAYLMKPGTSWARL